MAAAIVVLAVFAFGSRLAPTFGSRSGAKNPILEPDSIYHLVRIEATADDFPFVPMRNPREEFPDGSTYESPPLFPLLLAAPVWLLRRFFSADAATTRWILSFWGPASGAFSCVAFFLFIGVYVRATAWRFLAALLFGALPIGINYGFWGSVDYQPWIVGWTLLLFWAFLRGRDRLSTVALVVLFGTWQASILQSCTLLAGVTIGSMISGDRRGLDRLGRIFFLTSLVHLPVVGWVVLGGGGKLSPAFYGPGSLLAILSLGAASFSLGRRSWMWAVAAGAVLAPVAATVWKGLVVLYANPIPFLGSVTESAPLFRIGGEWNLRAPVYLLTPLVLVSPLVLIWLGRGWWRQRASEETAARALLVAAFGITWSAGLAQARHSEQWAPMALVVLVLGALSLGRGRWIACPLLILNAFPFIGATKERSVRPDYRVLEESLPFWRSLEGASGAGEGKAVLAGWEYGLFLEAYAGRTISIDARGPMSTPDWRWVSDFFLSEDEAGALEIAAKRRIGWVVVRDYYPMFQTYLAWGEKERSDYFVDDDRGARPTPRLLRTVGFRLCELLGVARPRAETDLAALGHFRLRWLSTAPPPDRAHLHPWWFKIYEIVPGVTIRSRERVRFQASLRLPNGLSIRYERESEPAPAGGWELTLPYSSDELSEGQILVDGRRIPYVATEAEVRKGATFDLNRESPPGEPKR